MSRTLRKSIVVLYLASFAGFGLVAAQAASAQSGRDTARAEARLTEKVRHELVMLLYLGVFDHLAFRVDGDRVTLLGYVTRPSLKSDAERVVRGIEAVASVKNQIEVLPVSPGDDRLRIRLYRAIYGGALQRYTLQPVPPIHIIVKNGHVILDGVVASEFDRNVAGIRANGVPGIFSVKNNLQVDRT